MPQHGSERYRYQTCPFYATYILCCYDWCKPFGVVQQKPNNTPRLPSRSPKINRTWVAITYSADVFFKHDQANPVRKHQRARSESNQCPQQVVHAIATLSSLLLLTELLPLTRPSKSIYPIQASLGLWVAQKWVQTKCRNDTCEPLQFSSRHTHG